MVFRLDMKTKDLTNVFDNLTQPMAILGPDSPYAMIYCNDAYCDLIGFDRQILLGHNPDEILSRTAYSLIPFPLPLAKEKIDTVMQHHRPDGRTVWAVVLIQPFFDDDGKLLGYIRMPREITETIHQFTQEISNEVTDIVTLVRLAFTDLRTSLKTL
jgi:PAS domain S-box-containing protein